MWKIAHFLKMHVHCAHVVCTLKCTHVVIKVECRCRQRYLGVAHFFKSDISSFNTCTCQGFNNCIISTLYIAVNFLVMSSIHRPIASEFPSSSSAWKTHPYLHTVFTPLVIFCYTFIVLYLISISMDKLIKPIISTVMYVSHCFTTEELKVMKCKKLDIVRFRYELDKN